MPELTQEQAAKLWAEAEPERKAMAKREAYYDGKHDILGTGGAYGDGIEKSETVTNWIAYIVNRYRGAISPYQITLIEGDDPEEQDAQDAVLVDMVQLFKDQNIDATDDVNLRNALTQGYGVEVHGFDSASDSIIIDYYPPREWVFPVDSDGIIYTAIRQVRLDRGSVYEDKFLEKPLDVMTVYTDKTITTYTRKEGVKEWSSGDEQPHKYGQIPVIQWTVGCEIVSDATMSQNDIYNSVDSMAGDAIVREVDSLLATIGLDGNWMKANYGEVKASRVLPLMEGGKAWILSRDMDVDRFTVNLDRIRGQIHIMGEVPDVAKVVGAAGSTSGIALKLMFTPMQERVEAIIPYLNQGVRARIDLINAVRRNKGQAELTGYQVTIQFQMPVNRIEEWQNIKALDGIVSHQTQLVLLTDIDSPQAELALLESEGPIREEPADAVAAIEERTAQRDVGAVTLEDKVAEMVDTISDAVTSRVIASGVIPPAPKV